ncbi:MAG TPA: glycosyltransferase family A protein [Candidatus Obscuribacterales bacterium]
MDRQKADHLTPVQEPLVSVVIPFFNQDEYLLDAVRSVEAQTYGNVEMVVVDDCSPRASAADLLSWRQISNLTIVRHAQNRGAAASRNSAVSSARGEFILPLDADDMITPDYVAKTSALLLQSPDVGAVWTHVQMFGDQEQVWQPDCTLPARLSFGGPNTFLYRRSLFEDVGGYSEDWQIAEDFDFWIKLLERHWKVACVQEPLYLRRKYSGSAMTRVNLVDKMRLLLRDHRPVCLAYLEVFVINELGKSWTSEKRYRQLLRDYAELLERRRQYDERARELGLNPRPFPVAGVGGS